MPADARLPEGLRPKAPCVHRRGSAVPCRYKSNIKSQKAKPHSKIQKPARLVDCHLCRRISYLVKREAYLANATVREASPARPMYSSTHMLIYRTPCVLSFLLDGLPRPGKIYAQHNRRDRMNVKQPQTVEPPGRIPASGRDGRDWGLGIADWEFANGRSGQSGSAVPQTKPISRVFDLKTRVV
jgi:hypothetical protein